MTDPHFLVTHGEDDRIWSDKEILDDELTDSQGSDVNVDVALGSHKVLGPVFCSLLRAGLPAPLQFAFTTRIPVFTDIVETVEFEGVSWVDVVESDSGRVFRAFRPDMAFDAVNYEKSDLEEWPDGSAIEPWHDPRGRLFFKPHIDWDRVAPDVDSFRLLDWKGSSNVVVSDDFRRGIAEVCGEFVGFKMRNPRD